jgi:fructose-1,6-bisphosphatase/inositol monophosphatase family enzyme
MAAGIQVTRCTPIIPCGHDTGWPARSLTLAYFQQPHLNVESKADHTPVTVADREAEQYLRERISDAVFVTSEVATFHQRGAAHLFDTLSRTCRVTRTWGDCYGYLLVATGRADLMIDPVMSIWDAAAILPVIEEAGGRFTDWSGRATVASQEGVACNTRLLPQVLPILQKTPVGHAASRVAAGG